MTQPARKVTVLLVALAFAPCEVEAQSPSASVRASCFALIDAAGSWVTWYGDSAVAGRDTVPHNAIIYLSDEREDAPYEVYRARSVSVWFAARPGEAWHATIHAALALGFGLWAHHRLRRAPRGEPALAVAADERLDRIERAIGAVAIEVERIGEMERFASKILAERATASAPASIAREPAPAHTRTPP